MAFLNFGKKNPEAPQMQQAPQIPSGPPTDLVLSMRQQGISNNQIVMNLQREGYSSSQVFDAMNQADIKGGIETPPGGALDTVPEMENPMQIPQPAMYSQRAPPPSPMQGMSLSGMPPMQGTEHERIEELAEAIIDEKWDALLKNIDKIVDWKNETEQRITQLEQKFSDLKDGFDKLHQALVGKIGEYDQHILDVGTQLKAMEGVFQKVLPSFTENVHELTRITDAMKKK